MSFFFFFSFFAFYGTIIKDAKPSGLIILKGSFIAATKKVKMPFAFEVADSRNGKVYFMGASSSAELEGWLDALEKGSKHNPVSGPITVSHKVHVNFDSETGGFTGLPPDWNDILHAHGITPQAYSSPQEAEREVETLMKVRFFFFFFSFCFSFSCRCLKQRHKVVIW
jgi:hypothetical protein